MWDLPGPGLEPMFPALAGGFLTTVPPGKPSVKFLLYDFSAFIDDYIFHFFILLIWLITLIDF